MSWLTGMDRFIDIRWLPTLKEIIRIVGPVVSVRIYNAFLDGGLIFQRIAITCVLMRAVFTSLLLVKYILFLLKMTAFTIEMYVYNNIQSILLSSVEDC